MEIVFAILFIIGKLIYEAFQTHKANNYANKVVRRYNDDGIPKI